jgi:hypothetical protein
LTANIQKDENGVHTIAPGKIKPSFKEFIGATNSTNSNINSNRNLSDTFSVAVAESRVQDTALSALSTLKANPCDCPVFARCLKNFLGLETSPTQEPDQLRGYISVWTFTTPNVNSIE